MFNDRMRGLYNRIWSFEYKLFNFEVRVLNEEFRFNFNNWSLEFCY